MHMRHNRTVNISKEKLIEKIKLNKETHIREYQEAVQIYIVEANKQLENSIAELTKGFLKVNINLTLPVNRTEEYDKVIEMFEWEINDNIELTQSEFNEYVHDDNDSAKMAKFQNSFYSNR